MLQVGIKISYVTYCETVSTATDVWRSNGAESGWGAAVYAPKSGAIFHPLFSLKYLYLDKTKAPKGFVDAWKTKLEQS